jgi:hypothetical protein
MTQVTPARRAPSGRAPREVAPAAHPARAGRRPAEQAPHTVGRAVGGKIGEGGGGGPRARTPAAAPPAPTTRASPAPPVAQDEPRACGARGHGAGARGRGRMHVAGDDAEQQRPLHHGRVAPVGLLRKDETCPLSTGGRTRRVQLVQGPGRARRAPALAPRVTRGPAPRPLY